MNNLSGEEESLIKFESPSTFIICGGTGSGKTSLLYQILRHGRGIFTSPPKKIFYCYGVYQGLYDEMKTNISNIEFFEGLPSKENSEIWGTESSHKILMTCFKKLPKAQTL